MFFIEATKLKLGEAQFFFSRLADINRRIVRREPEAFLYYLSAFLSAARSVTFALQAEEKAKYDAWFPTWQASLSQEDVALLTNFNNERVASVKRRGANVAQRTVSIPGHEYLAAALREGSNIEISGPLGVPLPQFSVPLYTFSFEGVDSEVVQAARAYLQLVARLVQEFCEHYSSE